MANINQKLKFVAWLIIGLWLSRWLIFRLVNIDFATIEIARGFRNVWLILIPLAVGILIVNSWKENATNTNRIVGLTTGILTTVGLMIVLNFLASICEWQFNYVQYEHSSKNMKIQNRFYDCGASTSGEPYELVLTKPLGIYLIKYKLIEEDLINKTEWIKK